MVDFFDRLLKHMRLKVIIGVVGLSIAVQTILKFIPDYGFPLANLVVGIVLFWWGARGD